MINEIDVKRIEDTVARLCVDANKILPESVVNSICAACKSETNGLGRDIMCDLVKNIDAAKELDIPVCQDTGMAVVFLEIGQDVHIVGGSLTDAVNSGVARGYTDGLLRKSVVADPLNRVNTDDNTPAVLHVSIVEGDSIKVTVAPKGFGSENMSKLKMFTPSAKREDIIDFIVDCVKTAGSNPCPPVVIGVGIGGDFEYSAILAKKALCRNVSDRNEDEFYADMEKELLERINALDIGPQGFGGKTTALCVNIETYPTHIAGLPVAVNVGCHVTRHASKTI